MTPGVGQLTVEWNPVAGATKYIVTLTSTEADKNIRQDPYSNGDSGFDERRSVYGDGEGCPAMMALTHLMTRTRIPMKDRPHRGSRARRSRARCKT